MLLAAFAAGTLIIPKIKSEANKVTFALMNLILQEYPLYKRMHIGCLGAYEKSWNLTVASLEA